MNGLNCKNLYVEEDYEPQDIAIYLNYDNDNFPLVQAIKIRNRVFL